MSYKKNMMFFCGFLLSNFMLMPLGSVYSLNGCVYAGDSEIRTGLITGNGTIVANNLVVSCDDFQFKGTIDCSGECIINCRKPFDYSNFIRKGKGSVTIAIGPNDFRRFTEEGLKAYCMRSMDESMAGADDETFNNMMNTIRYYAASNGIGEREIFEKVIKDIDDTVDDIHAHLDKKYDTRQLKTASIDLVGIGTLAGLSYLLYDQQIAIQERFPSVTFDHIGSGICIGGLLSCAMGAHLWQTVAAGFLVRRKQRLANLQALKGKIIQSLAVPYVFEKDRIVKLQ